MNEKADLIELRKAYFTNKGMNERLFNSQYTNFVFMKHWIFYLVFLTQAIEVKSQENPVLVELFTYNGCSNCASAGKNFKDFFPPGDSLLKVPVILLTYHVDYDEHDGFQDPFDDQRWKDRQKQYARFGISDGIYTPQVIVNGRSAFSGSNRARVFREINQADSIKNQPDYSLKFNVDSISNLIVKASTNEPLNNYILNYALVKKIKISNPATGENAGRTMYSYNVVRDLLSILPGNKSPQKFNLPSNEKWEDYQFISFLQRIEDGQILSVRLHELN
jgi:hypothetical protein